VGILASRRWWGRRIGGPLLCDDARVDDLASLIERSHARWVPQVVEAVLSTDDPALVAEVLTQAVGTALAASVVGAHFYEPGVGIVAGLELTDGRAVVAKVHRASWVTRPRLDEIIRVQAQLARSGQPAPAPLAGPLPLGAGWLTVEELRAGDTADGRDPAVRRGMATALHDLIATAPPPERISELGTWPGDAVIDELWPQPHDLRFDLMGTAAGAEWIDDAARAARATLTTTALPAVVGHLDWRVQNLAFAGTSVTAIYDWDSVSIAPEAAVVGSASVIHPIDWRLELADPLPTVEQVDAFVADYESARAEPFDDEARSVLSAAQVWVASHGARCQHSDDVLGVFPDVDHSRGWPRILRELLAR
jgi:hypothetical protein